MNDKIIPQFRIIEDYDHAIASPWISGWLESDVDILRNNLPNSGLYIEFNEPPNSMDYHTESQLREIVDNYKMKKQKAADKRKADKLKRYLSLKKEFENEQ